MSRSADVDAYIAAQTPLRRERLTALRDAIHRAAPDVAESIEWKMPIYRRGERFIGTASQKQYLSVYIGQEAVAAVLAAAPGLKSGKGCLNITDTKPLPLDALAEQIAKKFR
jgi:uncharacterized protein YdhG (YjbR/CyaY superfamily)